MSAIGEARFGKAQGWIGPCARCRERRALGGSACDRHDLMLPPPTPEWNAPTYPRRAGRQEPVRPEDWDGD